MAHRLVIGGTGMLRGTVLALARPGDVVSVVARSGARLDSLVIEAARAGGEVAPIRADYRDIEDFARALRDAVEAHGPADPAVCWIHSDAPEAPLVVAEALLPAGPFRYFDVVGTGDPEATARADRRSASLGVFEGLDYRRIVLGHRTEGGRTRWLTSAEIGAGVAEAVLADAERHVVGEL